MVTLGVSGTEVQSPEEKPVPSALSFPCRISCRGGPALFCPVLPQPRLHSTPTVPWLLLELRSGMREALGL